VVLRINRAPRNGKKGFDVTFLPMRLANNVPAYEASIRINYLFTANAAMTVKVLPPSKTSTGRNIEVRADTVCGLTTARLARLKSRRSDRGN